MRLLTSPIDNIFHGSDLLATKEHVHWECHWTSNTWANCQLWWVWAPLSPSFLLELWSPPWVFRLLYLDHLRSEPLIWLPRALYSCPWSLRRSLRGLLQWRLSLWWRLCDQWLPEELEQTPDSLSVTDRKVSISSNHSTYDGLPPSNDVGDGSLGLSFGSLLNILMSGSSWIFDRRFFSFSPDDDVIWSLVGRVAESSWPDMTGQKDVANERVPECDSALLPCQISTMTGEENTDSFWLEPREAMMWSLDLWQN